MCLSNCKNESDIELGNATTCIYFNNLEVINFLFTSNLISRNYITSSEICILTMLKNKDNWSFKNNQLGAIIQRFKDVVFGYIHNIVYYNKKKFLFYMAFNG